jgi:hypothetical protein
MKNFATILIFLIMLLAPLLLAPRCQEVSDADLDGVPDDIDNCPQENNGLQLNRDGDGQGDACDADDDADGVADENDNCPFMANTDQLDSDTDGIGDACANGPATWNLFLGESHYSDEGNAIVATSDGGVAILGTTGSYGAGNDDAWLVRLDRFGNPLWEKTFGGAGNDQGIDLLPSADGGFIMLGFKVVIQGDARTQGDAGTWLWQVDALGHEVWEKILREDGNPRGVELIATSDGGYALAGSITAPNGKTDAYLAKLDRLGNKSWSAHYGGAYDDVATSLKQTADGGYILTGLLNIDSTDNHDTVLWKTKPSGALDWQKLFGSPGLDDGMAVVVAPDQGFLIAASRLALGGFGADLWLIHTDQFGKGIWEKSYGNIVGPFYPGNMLSATTDGSFILTGATWNDSTSYELLLLKVDASGGMLWRKTYGQIDQDTGHAVIPLVDGGYLATGYLGTPPTNPTQFWAMKTDAAGNVAGQ